MQVQTIGNNMASVKFSADPSTEKAKACVNMNDSQLKTFAYIAAQDKNSEKNNRKSIISTLYALPLAASISTGILTKGKLGTRAVASAKEAGKWGFALLALGAFNTAKNAVVSRSKKLKEFENNHPIASTLTDVGLFVGALTLGTKGAKAIAAKIATKSPKITTMLFTKLQNAKRFINNSMINKKVLPSILNNVAKLEKKAPWAVAAGTAVVANSVLILFLAGMLRGNSNEKQTKKNIENNYRDLKKAQLETAKRLTNVLAQDSSIVK